MMNDGLKKEIINVIETHKQLIAELQERGAQTLATAAEAVTKAIKQNGTIYICGNGGSAADAQHIASELTGRFERERRPLPAVALTTDTSVITSIANDYGFENVFVKQIEALIGQDDILWAISTSGASPNVIAAVELAKEKGARVLAFTGRPNSKLEQMADISFCANTASTARSQEIHQVAYHIICGLVEQSFCEQPQKKMR
jgi:D-sedoheptulose 7-phosphate isomerase